MVVTFISIRFLTNEHSLMFSIMQLVCPFALSCYSCCVKNQFTRRWSHVFVGILLLCVVGASIGLHVERVVDWIVCGLIVAIWATLMIDNHMELLEGLKSNDSFFVVLVI